MKRKAAVAGAFYPASARELRLQVEGMLDASAGRVAAKAIVAPHAGYVYSGPVAGAVYASVVVPDLAVVLAPSHRPIRPTFALMEAGSWETPLGTVPVDAALAAAILKRASESAVVDPSAHDREHSLEVQLPFLQVLNPDIAIVPIAVSYLAGYAALESLGRAVAGAILDGGRDVLIVASTDMSHYLSRREAEARDALALKAILALDPRGLFDVVKSEDISMCGFQPTAAALVAAKALGATKAEIVRYGTSGDRTGDDREVVAYAGIRIY
jgi:MEMO1 family protein